MSGAPARARRDMRRIRLLPVTILVMSALLGVKSVSLVRAATGQVPAAATVKPTDAAAAISAPATPAVAKPPDKPPPQPVSDAERDLLLDLRHRREALEARAASLDARQSVLDATAHRLADRLDELTALQTRLESLEADRRARETANWAGLVKVYESMKPRDAAAIFDDLDMQVLLPVLDRMKETKAAPILAAMAPDRARLATQQLADLRTRAITPPAATAPLPKS